MAKNSLLQWNNAGDWTGISSAALSGRTRRSTSASDQDFGRKFLASNVTIAETWQATAKPNRRAAGITVIDASVHAKPGERYVIAIRHPSGALSFHVPTAEGERRMTRRALGTTYRFNIPLRAVASPSIRQSAAPRRGILAKVVKVIVLKIAGAAFDGVLPDLVRKWEINAWKKRPEGLVLVTAGGLQKDKLTPVKLAAGSGSGERALLLIHGTFSHTAAAFQALVATDFFERVSKLYGNRIFGFDHFSLSKTPEENAKELLAAICRTNFQFDVVTHSRGGLVLRNLVERGSALDSSAKFQLGHAILVASPNEGTPLATPDHWRQTVGWIATLVDALPAETPLAFAASWVADAIPWLAQRAVGAMPGIASMDSAGLLLKELNQPPGPPTGSYSALAANFAPDASWLAAMADIGIDAFFGQASDLVVPTAGGWSIDLNDITVPAIPADRVGCYGPGGNLAAPKPVHHLNFFGLKQTADFLAQALVGESHGLDPIDLLRPLPNRRRGLDDAVPESTAVFESAPARAAAYPVAAPDAAVSAGLAEERVFSDSLQLTILEPPGWRKRAPLQLLASYGGARVVIPFPTSGKEAGQRWFRIIRMHERMKEYVDGRSGVRMPTDDELISYGEDLFNALLPLDVRRLYDVARSKERSGHLNVIFTSMVPWIADKPWEFAFDPQRKTYLATEDLHFIRNAITAIPADRLQARDRRLRILVAAAQPFGTPEISAADEEELIRRSFQPLIEARLVEIRILSGATPNSLHRWLSSEDFDVVHFVGHGEFDQDENQGYLIFEDKRGAVQRVDARTAREMLCQRGVRLVFLNACETGTGGRADFNRGVAPALIAAGIPAVVANQFKVLDQSATEFAQHFYWSIAQGMTIGASAREARIAVNYSISGETIDWAVPVVYARDPESRLCAPKIPTPESVRVTMVPQSARRATSKHKKRVAIWDVNKKFPQIKSTLATLNAAQGMFGFEAVDLSAPMGTLQESEEGTTQLRADVAAGRLKNKLTELGTDFLFCITQYPLMYEEDGVLYWNYYNWWPGPEEPKIIIFSVAFDEMPFAGAGADRAIANGIVQGMVGILADKGTHERGPKDCPLYHNEERDLDLVTNHQHFDKRCAAELKRKLKGYFAPLTAILDAFGD